MKEALASNQISIQLEDLTEFQYQSLIRVQDPNFNNHHGVDLKTHGSGWTTITQALVKIHYFKNFTPGLKKVRQSLIAWLILDPLVSKEDQLTLFINEAYLGQYKDKSVIGFEEAARIYFGKSFSAIDEQEYLSLVAMLIGPNRYHVIHYPEINAERVNRIRKLLTGQCQPLGWSDILLEGCK
jgi:membrane peptidoglycan carboxypeptidase